MRHRSFIALAVLLGLLIFGAVGVYAYDAVRGEKIARGVAVAGVDLSGMTANQARAELEDRLATAHQQPIAIRHGKRRFRLTVAAARLHADVERMVQEALHESRRGNLIARTVRSLTGSGVDASLPPRIGYSRAAVARKVRQIKRRVDRPARDAQVVPSPTGLSTAPPKDGVEVLDGALRAEIVRRIEDLSADRTVRVKTKRTRPQVTEDQLPARYPHYITVDRAGFKLRHYRKLKRVKTYPIAVGQAGFDTPAGVYYIQNKAVNPAWSVPNREWAGSLAGQVIPGGAPNNPLRERWMGFWDGAGIHGTAETGSIGTRASHGCVRMLIPDVIELYEKIPVQTPIYIGG